MLSSIKPKVRQAAATIGQVMVIQFMAQYRCLCLAQSTKSWRYERPPQVSIARRSALHVSYARVTVPPERAAHKVMVELAIGAPHPRTWPLRLAEVVRLAGRRRMALTSRQELCASGLGAGTADPGHATRPAGPAMYLARRLAAWTSGSRARGGSRAGGK